MREFPKAWAESGTALLAGAAPLDTALADSTTPAVLSLVDLIEDHALHVDEPRAAAKALNLTRYWSVLGAAASGWATLAIAYCPWHLMPQTPQELAIVLFGAVAGGSGALAMILHPEERP